MGSHIRASQATVPGQKLGKKASNTAMGLRNIFSLMLLVAAILVVANAAPLGSSDSEAVLSRVRRSWWDSISEGFESMGDSIVNGANNLGDALDFESWDDTLESWGDNIQNGASNVGETVSNWGDSIRENINL